VQIVSITGMWGLTFLVGWTAAMIAWAWEHDFERARIARGAAIWAGALVVVLAYGSIRLARLAPAGERVRVAGLAADEEPGAGFAQMFDAAIIQKRLADEDRVTLGRTVRDRLALLLDRTRAEARAGARIVYWNEAAAIL